MGEKRFIGKYSKIPQETTQVKVKDFLSTDDGSILCFTAEDKPVSIPQGTVLNLDIPPDLLTQDYEKSLCDVQIFFEHKGHVFRLENPNKVEPVVPESPIPQNEITAEV